MNLNPSSLAPESVLLYSSESGEWISSAIIMKVVKGAVEKAGAFRHILEGQCIGWVAPNSPDISDRSFLEYHIISLAWFHDICPHLSHGIILPKQMIPFLGITIFIF